MRTAARRCLVERSPTASFTPQEVNGLTNVQHTSRIDGIAAALKALGKRLDIRTV